MTSLDDELKVSFRKFLADKGTKVKFEDDEPDYWGEMRVSTYGWKDYDASEHIRPHQYGHPKDSLVKGCFWIIPKGTMVTEKTYSVFNGTFVDNENEVGLNAEGVSCACGKYTNVTLRVTSSLGDAIQALLGYDPTKQVTL